MSTMSTMTTVTGSVGRPMRSVPSWPSWRSSRSYGPCGRCLLACLAVTRQRACNTHYLRVSTCLRACRSRRRPSDAVQRQPCAAGSFALPPQSGSRRARLPCEEHLSADSQTDLHPRALSCPCLSFSVSWGRLHARSAAETHTGPPHALTLLPACPGVIMRGASPSPPLVPVVAFPGACRGPGRARNCPLYMHTCVSSVLFLTCTVQYSYSIIVFLNNIEKRRDASGAAPGGGRARKNGPWMMAAGEHVLGACASPTGRTYVVACACDD